MSANYLLIIFYAMRMTLWDPYKVRRMIDETWGDDFGMNWDDNELDMYEEEGKFVIKLKAPGFDDKNVDITIDANSVTIMGKAEKEEEEEDKKRISYKIFYKNRKPA